jgi:hypothetical protein
MTCTKVGVLKGGVHHHADVIYYTKGNRMPELHEDKVDDEREGRRPSLEVQIDLETVEERRKIIALLGGKSDEVFSRGVEGLIPFEKSVSKLSWDIDDCQYVVEPKEVRRLVLKFLGRVGELRKHIGYDQEIQNRLQWLDLLINKRWKMEKKDGIKQVYNGMYQIKHSKTENTFEQDCQRAAYFLTGAFCESTDV